jgi:general secretion pathway protein B
MSILLDSLRKSEAQRRIKDAPSIHSAEAYGSRAQRPRQWLALAMIGLTAGAIAWFGWQQFADPATRPGAAAAVAANDRAPAAESDAGTDPPASLEARQDAPPRTPVERLSQAPETASAEPPATSSPANRIAAFVAEEEEMGEEAGEPFAEEFAEDGEDLAVADESPDDILTDDFGPDDFGSEDFGAEDFDELEPAAREPVRRAELDEAGPRSYWQLPQSWRSEMPEFKITVLVFAESAEDRFLLMNGERLREGDEVEGGVVLEEIRRDGAVFSYRQTRFLVKS